jgi:small-conductance mechanosensitive channel
MKNYAKKILGAILLIAVLLLSSKVPAHEQSQVDQTSTAKAEAPAPALDLAVIIPLAATLSSRLTALENQLTGLLNISEVESKLAEIEANLMDPAVQLQQLKDSKDYRFKKLVALREAIEHENKSFEQINEPLSKAIRQLGTWRTEWLAEKKRWNELRSSLYEEGALDQFDSTFAKANETIDTALNLILSQLTAVLTAQAKASNIQAKIDTLDAEISGLVLAKRRGVMIDASPPMFSSRYVSQFSNRLWYALQQGLDEISWPGGRFFYRQGWIVLLQGLISLFVIIAIYRKRQILKDSEHWRFIAARPFSAGLFFGSIVAFLFFEYQGFPDTIELGNTMVAGISFARLIGVLNESSWKRQFVYGLIIVLIVNVSLDVISLPLPIFRIYTVLTALVGLIFCLRSARESIRQKDAGLYTWLLRLGFLFFVFIIIMEIWGKAALAQYIFVSLIDSTATALVFMLFMYMIRGVVEWVFRGSPLRRTTVLYKDPDAIVRQLAFFFDAAICGLVLLPALFMIWGVYDDLQGAINGLLTLGFNLGSQRISVGLAITAAGILYGSFLVSWIVQKLLMDEILARRRVETGVRVSIARLVHYVFIFAGFVLALLALGFEFTKLTIVLSALGVGIGFGLQAVVNNFVSGLILLFERPVRVGDYIEIGVNWAEIKKIGLRATTVQTFDQADVIIPNADLITNQVTNWTLSNRRVRLIIPVGVAYGSDVALVMETLMACAKTSSNVAKAPAPQVLFLSFGESSLDFELRVWVLDAEERMKVKSELHQEIDRSFRETKIEIAFPQRDLHLRSLDEEITLRHKEETI